VIASTAAGAPALSAGTPDLDRIVGDLTRLGVTSGPMPLLVHCSLRRLGPIAGGAATLLQALQTAVSSAGTIVVPALTPNNSRSSNAHRSAVADRRGSSKRAYLATMKGFDQRSTPSFGVGAFAEYVRQRPESVRSAHPQTSFAAVGPDSRALLDDHDLDCHLGEASPLGKLYHRDTPVLLIGVSYESFTAFHLAEYRLRRLSFRKYRCFLDKNGFRQQFRYRDVDLSDHDFPQLGRALESAHPIPTDHVGLAEARLVPMRLAVDFAVSWLTDHRGTGLADRHRSTYPRR
jgi:aminoglycoside 3-N-acetyltransferase